MNNTKTASPPDLRFAYLLILMRYPHTGLTKALRPAYVRLSALGYDLIFTLRMVTKIQSRYNRESFNNWKEVVQCQVLWMLCRLPRVFMTNVGAASYDRS